MKKGNSFFLKWLSEEKHLMCDEGFFYVLEEHKTIDGFAKVAKVKKLNALFHIELIKHQEKVLLKGIYRK